MRWRLQSTCTSERRYYAAIHTKPRSFLRVKHSVFNRSDSRVDLSVFLNNQQKIVMCWNRAHMQMPRIADIERLRHKFLFKQ